MKLPPNRHFPDDEEFKRQLGRRDVYNFRSNKYLLRRLENHETKEPVSVQEYMIEHILPQNENLSVEWRNALGPEWEKVRDKWLHTLGNLTLTGYNSEHGDRSFTQKRDMPGGFRQSPLRLNSGLGELGTWNKNTIQERAERLAQKAVLIWAPPAPPDDVPATRR